MLGYVCWVGLFGGDVVTVDGIEWGSPILVAGKRPDWLGDYNGSLGYIRSDTGQYGPGVMWSERDIVRNSSGWRNVTAIILPADHHHYHPKPIAQPSPADTVTVQMSEDEAREMLTYDHDAIIQCMTEWGFIRRQSKAERIAKSTNLSLADVERVLAAFEESE